MFIVCVNLLESTYCTMKPLISANYDFTSVTFMAYCRRHTNLKTCVRITKSGIDLLQKTN